MATKAQIIEFIIETFTEANGEPVSKSKLENYKKSDLEKFVTDHNSEEDLKNWLASK